MLNRIVQKAGLYDLSNSGKKSLQVGRYSNLPDITQMESLTPSACFLGPQAENIEAFKNIIGRALDHIQAYREHTYSPADPHIKFDCCHNQSLELLISRFENFCTFLDKYETPYSSLRYQGHMLSDNLIPALAAYFVTMLHNPNNVTIQASTATTLLEMLVMRDLCNMVGFTSYKIDYDTSLEYTVIPWAHTTVDGSVANIEGLWSARESRFLPFAVKLAVVHKMLPEDALEIEVTSCDGQVDKLRNCNDWFLLNMIRNDRLALPSRIASFLNMDILKVWEQIATHDVNALGWKPFESCFGDNWPIVLIPSTAHYSWPKASAILGLGSDGCRRVSVDRLGRMDMGKLDEILNEELKRKRPVLAVVSVFGSTEESAVDPTDEILEIRDHYREEGLDFDIHIDGAWGGYIISSIRDAYEIDTLPDSILKAGDNYKDDSDIFLKDTSKVPLNDHVIQQAKQIRLADSVTIDPHKMGYIQYPAGFVMYGNQDVTNLTTFTGSYIGSAQDPTMGLFGIEGSRPGAAPAAVYFSHSCVRPDYTGYGKVICRSLHNTRQFYAALLLINDLKDAHFKTVTLTPPTQNQNFARMVFCKSLDQIIAGGIMSGYKEFGPDQNIVDYGFNPLGNSDYTVYNEFITAVYDKLHVPCTDPKHPTPIMKFPLFVTVTEFNIADYGELFMKDFAERLGFDTVHEKIPTSLKCLRSTVMSPFVSDTENGSFWPEVRNTLLRTVNSIIECSDTKETLDLAHSL